MDAIPNNEIWWCNSHGRRATAIDENGQHVCGPEYKGGIMLPCNAVELTGLVELYEGKPQENIE